MQSLVTFLTPGLATAAAVALLAGLMRGFAGFGSGMLMAPVYGIVGLQASHGAWSHGLNRGADNSDPLIGPFKISRSPQRHRGTE